MDGEVTNALQAADREAQYDNAAKRLLSNKYILAHILVGTVDEFRGMDPKDVIPLIEGEPYIGSVPVEPGLTNEAQERVVGLNTEYGELHEGLVRFDIVFYVRTRDGLAQIIVNVEAQRDELLPYALLNRAIFYVCRLVSSQKERDFTHTNYDDIKRVYSIWICMNQEEDSLDYIHLTGEKLLGQRYWPGKLDLLNIVLLGLSRTLPQPEEQHRLHRLLGTLFSTKLSVEEKLGIIGDEYDIPTTVAISEGVSSMNLGQGLREEGRREGIDEGWARRTAKTILNMYKKGYPLEEIADLNDRTLSEVEKIIAAAQ